MPDIMLLAIPRTAKIVINSLPPPIYGQRVNPISTRGADHAHYSTTSPPPGFSDLATGLVCSKYNISGTRSSKNSRSEIPPFKKIKTNTLWYSHLTIALVANYLSKVMRLGRSVGPHHLALCMGFL